MVKYFVFFSLEIGRLLSNITKKTPQKIYLYRLLFIPDSPEETPFVCPFLFQIVFGQFFSIMCVKITWKLNISFTYVSVMNNWCKCYWRNAENENWCGKYANLNDWMLISYKEKTRVLQPNTSCHLYIACIKQSIFCRVH